MVDYSSVSMNEAVYSCANFQEDLEREKRAGVRALEGVTAGKGCMTNTNSGTQLPSNDREGVPAETQEGDMMIEMKDVDEMVQSTDSLGSDVLARKQQEEEQEARDAEARDRADPFAGSGRSGPRSDIMDVEEGHNGVEGTSTAGSNLTNRMDIRVDIEQQRHIGRMSRKERILNVLNHLIPIKQTYDRINNGLTTGRMQSNVPGRFIGQGTDGVFRNLMAKPDTDSSRQEQETNPPTYEEAAADATPEYWESTVISPMYEDEVFVEGLPVGNIANFVWNTLVTVAFQFVGFVLCYLLHTSHAAKQGSRAGLGINFVVLGYGMTPSNFGDSDDLPDRFEPDDPNSFDIDKSSSINGKLDTYDSGLFQQTSSSKIEFDSSNTPYFAYGLIAFGLFIIIKACVDFYRVKQMERKILVPPSDSSVQQTTVMEFVNHPLEDS